MNDKIWVWGKTVVGVIIGVIFCFLCVRFIRLEIRMINMQTQLDDMQIQSDSQSHALLVLDRVVLQQQEEIDALITSLVVKAPVPPTSMGDVGTFPTPVQSQTVPQ